MAKFGNTGIGSSNRAAIERVRARLEGLSEASIRKADSRAMASVKRRFEPVAKRVLRDRYNVTLGKLSGQFQVRTAREGQGEVLELYAATRKVPLIAFGGRWRWRGRHGPGATAEILRTERKTYDSAFIATINGRREIWVRQFSATATTPSGRDPRNKVRPLRGPSPLQMVKGIGDVNAAAIAAEINAFRSSEIIRQLGLAKRGKL